MHYVTREEMAALMTPEYEAAHKMVMDHVRPPLSQLRPK
jgi:hypothetical protein